MFRHWREWRFKRLNRLAQLQRKEWLDKEDLLELLVLWDLSRGTRLRKRLLWPLSAIARIVTAPIRSLRNAVNSDEESIRNRFSEIEHACRVCMSKKIYTDLFEPSWYEIQAEYWNSRKDWRKYPVVLYLINLRLGFRSAGLVRGCWVAAGWDRFCYKLLGWIAALFYLFK